METDLALIIVSWNTRDLLAQCLASVHAHSPGGRLEILVVDNASTDGSAAMVREHFPQVRLIDNSENVGFARANNQAIPLISGQYILLLNPDAVVLAGTLDKLASHLDTYPTVGVVGADLLNLDGTRQHAWDWFPSLASEFVPERLRRRKPAVHAEDALSVDWVKGAALMIRRSVIEQIGVLDEDYYLYTEEADWCYRARRAGWDIHFLPGAYVIHHEHAATQKRHVFGFLSFYRSRFLFVYKHAPHWQLRLLGLTLAIKTIFRLAQGEAAPLAKTRPPGSTMAEVHLAYRRLLSMSLFSILFGRPAPMPTIR